MAKYREIKGVTIQTRDTDPELNNLGTARNGGGAAGQSSTNALYAGGSTGSNTAAAEEFTTSIANKTITTS